MSKRLKVDKLGTAARAATIVVSVLTLAEAAVFVYRGIFYEVAICLVSLAIFVYVQLFLNRHRWLRNPPAMQWLIAGVFFLGVTVGRFFFLYARQPGFDKLMHVLYGAVFCIIGFPLFYRLNPGQRQKRTVSPATLFLFAVCFAIACSFFWEVYEFASDRLFGTDMQHWRESLTSGITDTMLDQLCNLLGMNVVGLIWVRALRRDPQTFYRRRIAPFLEPDAASGPARTDES